MLDFSAKKSLENLKMSKKDQSILITGVTGSGKTETQKHIIEFLSQNSNLQNIFRATLILEEFGNAKTCGNTNSSRFCKQVEVI